jgi:hypothetical protein
MLPPSHSFHHATANPNTTPIGNRLRPTHSLAAIVDISSGDPIKISNTTEVLTMLNILALQCMAWTALTLLFLNIT